MREPTLCAQCGAIHTPGSCPSESPAAEPTQDAAAQREQTAQVLQNALVSYLARLPAYPGRIEETLAEAHRQGVSLDVSRAFRQGIVKIFTWSSTWSDPRKDADALLTAAAEHGIDSDALLRDLEVVTEVQRQLALCVARSGVGTFRALFKWAERRGMTIDATLVLHGALVDALQRGADGQARAILKLASSSNASIDCANPTIIAALTDGIVNALTDGSADTAKRLLTFAERQQIPVDMSDARISQGWSDGLTKHMGMLAGGPGFAAEADRLIAFGRRALHRAPDSEVMQNAINGSLADAMRKAWMFDAGGLGGILTALHPVHGVLGFVQRHRIPINIARAAALAEVRAEARGDTTSAESIRTHATELGVDRAAMQSELPYAITRVLAECRAKGAPKEEVETILRMAIAHGIALA